MTPRRRADRSDWRWEAEMRSEWFWGGEVTDEDVQRRAIRWLRATPFMADAFEFVSSMAGVATVLKVPTPWMRGAEGTLQRDREVHFCGLAGAASGRAPTLNERLDYGFVFDRTRHGILYSVLHVPTLLDDRHLDATELARVRSLADDGVDYIASAGGHASGTRGDVRTGVLLALFSARYCPLMDAGEDWGGYESCQQRLMESEQLARLLDDRTTWAEALQILDLEAAQAGVVH